MLGTRQRIVSIAGVLALAYGSACTLLIPFAEEEGAQACGDGVDNDGDGRVDCDDPGCDGSCAEDSAATCADARDNDRDGLRDGADPGCFAHGATIAERRCSSVRGTEASSDDIAGAILMLRNTELRPEPGVLLRVGSDEPGFAVSTDASTGAVEGLTLELTAVAAFDPERGLIGGVVELVSGDALLEGFGEPFPGSPPPDALAIVAGVDGPYLELRAGDRAVRARCAVCNPSGGPRRFAVRVEGGGFRMTEPIELALELPDTIRDGAPLNLRFRGAFDLHEIRLARPRFDPCDAANPSLRPPASARALAASHGASDAELCVLVREGEDRELVPPRPGTLRAYASSDGGETWDAADDLRLPLQEHATLAFDAARATWIAVTHGPAHLTGTRVWHARSFCAQWEYVAPLELPFGAPGAAPLTGLGYEVDPSGVHHLAIASDDRVEVWESADGTPSFAPARVALRESDGALIAVASLRGQLLVLQRDGGAGIVLAGESEGRLRDGPTALGGTGVQGTVDRAGIDWACLAPRAITDGRELPFTVVYGGLEGWGAEPADHVSTMELSVR